MSTTGALIERLLLTHEVGDISVLYDPESNTIGLFQGDGRDEQQIVLRADLLHQLAATLQWIDFNLCRIGKVP